MRKVNQRTGQRTGDVTSSSGEDRQRMSCRSLLGRLGTRAVHRRMVSREALSCCHPIAVCAPTESSLVVCAGSSDAEGIEMPIFPCPTCTLPRTRAWCVCPCANFPIVLSVNCSQETIVPAQATQASAAPSYHVLQYKYVPDILEKRGPFREKHLAAASQKVDNYHSCLVLRLMLSHAFSKCLIDRCRSTSPLLCSRHGNLAER